VTLDLGPQGAPVHPVDTTTAGSINVRYWLPPEPHTSLIIYCHQLSGNEFISSSYWAYPLVHAAIQEGWAVAASRAHGDNWGNDASQTDVRNLYDLVNALSATSKVVLVGASMGALDAALVHANDVLPAGVVKGIYIVDGVLDLSWAYTASPNGTTNGFQASINGAYGVSDYASIPAGHNPMTRSASDFTDVRWRFSASTADTSVLKANNTDPFITKIASAAEKSLTTHNSSGHTQQALGADLVAFAKRCGL